jgi:hypothetical protein
MADRELHAAAKERRGGRRALNELLADRLGIPLPERLRAHDPIQIAEEILTQLPAWLLLRRSELRDGHITGAVEGLREIATLLEKMHASSAIGRSGPITRRD